MNKHVACKPNKQDICDELIWANVDDSAQLNIDDEDRDESDDRLPSNNKIINANIVLWKAVQYHKDGALFDQYLRSIWTCNYEVDGRWL